MFTTFLLWNPAALVTPRREYSQQLLREDRRGQEASSLVIYMRDPVEVRSLRMGRRLFRTTAYDWDR